MNAYNDLLARFLEYLKDCLCEHLLVANPDTRRKRSSTSAPSAIRRPQEPRGESRVYKVCNLSRRRYVKSFPAIGHWLSLVPVLPFLDLLVELFCCWVMPDTFGRYAAADFDEDAVAGAADARSGSAPRARAPTRSRPSRPSARSAELFGKFLQFGKVATAST